MGGLVFEFTTPPFKNTHWNATSKYLAESAFSFIEGIIYYNVPNYQNFGNWGSNAGYSITMVTDKISIIQT